MDVQYVFVMVGIVGNLSFGGFPSDAVIICVLMHVVLVNHIYYTDQV